MSVTTSSANVDPPPLLFGTRSPTPPSPSFPQQRRSPSHSRPSPSPLSSQNHHFPPQDIEMSGSRGAAPQQAQDPDHDGSQPDEDAATWHSASSHNTPESQAPIHEDDAMDTTPDPTLHPDAVPAADGGGGGGNEAGTDGADGSRSPAELNPTGTASTLPPDQFPLPPLADIVRVMSNGESVDTSYDDEAPMPLPPLLLQADNFTQAGSNPDSPPVDNPVPDEEDGDEESSSEDEDTGMPWTEPVEDHSSPSETELGEIVAAGEHSALDRKYLTSHGYL